VRRNGEYLYEDDILAILRRFDKDGDARLSYVEFVNAVLPNNINKRLALKLNSPKKER
jgi:Ca2+-binding EF-hand superfamily protein